MLRDWTILLVDDDQKSLEIMVELTTFFGATAHRAENGKAGLELARTVQPDFILTDLSMPVMDGWEMIKQLKNDPALAKIPIIALTAHAMVGDREKALAAGCHNYLSKPLRPESFGKQLNQLLSDIPELAGKLAG